MFSEFPWELSVLCTLWAVLDVNLLLELITSGCFIT